MPKWPVIDITEYALPTACRLACGDGQLVNCLRCVALRSGQALLYQEIGDLFATADLGPRGEQLSWARPHSDPLTPTNGTTAGRAFAYSSARATAAPRTTSDLLTTMIESPGQR